MKLIKVILIVGAVLCWTAVSSAGLNTTVTTNASGGLTVTTNSTSIWSDIGQVGSDALGALGQANFANGINVTPGGIYHDGNYGGFIAISTANTNGVNLGFALAGIHNSSKAGSKFDFYDATLNINFGTTVLNLLGRFPVYSYIEAGPACNLRNPTALLEQSIAGTKVYLLQNRLSIGAGVGQNSEWTTPFYIFDLTYRF